MTISRFERAALCELLLSLGPDAPTLCEGWSTRDLAAHLAARERRMDAAPGIAVPALAGHLASVQAGYAKQPYDDLVALVRSGPPRWSAFALPGADRLLNTTEFFVHHEDVRRAQPEWAPRTLPDRVQDGLWSAVRTRSRLAFRSSPVGVVLRRPGGDQVVAKPGTPEVAVTGEPAELLLFLFGRGGFARVELTGPAEAVAALRETSLAV